MSVDSVKKKLRTMAMTILRPGPPKPGPVVEELLTSLSMMPKHLHQLNKVFHTLRQKGSDTIELDTNQIASSVLLDIVLERKVWVEKILTNLCQLAGCAETLDWDSFLYVTLRFASLSKVELAQCMFYIIVKEVKSWTVHFLTTRQLKEFYGFYTNCPVTSFSTKEISFSKHLSLTRYYVPDFVELCHRFSQLINPAIHLQRSFQAVLPSVSFWNNYDRVEVYNRKVTLDFFKLRKTHVFLRGVPPFRESCDMLLPDTLGAEPINEDQWKLRAPHYDSSQGVWPAGAGRPGGNPQPLGANTGANPPYSSSVQPLGASASAPHLESSGFAPPSGAPPPLGFTDPAQSSTHVQPHADIPVGVGSRVAIPRCNDIGVVAVKNAVQGTLGGYNPSVDEGAPMGALPKWIREFVTIPVKKGTATRISEVDFIASSSKVTTTRVRTQVDMMQQSHPSELLDRPQQRLASLRSN